METILVTGANGFIGGAMARKLLKEGYRVIGIVSNTNGLNDIVNNPNFRYEIVLFENYKNISQIVNEHIDGVFHYAWQGLCGNDAKLVDYQLVNISASCSLCEECIKLGIKKFIFASTMNTIDVRNFMNKETTAKPRGAFIHSGAKLLTELYLKTICSNSNIEINVSYIAMAYGPKNYSKMVPNIVISQLLNNESPKLVSGNSKYDLIYIDDIVDAFLTIYQKGINMKSYYIGHRSIKSFKEIFNNIRQIINPQITLQFGVYKDDTNIDYSLINVEELYIDTGWSAKSDFKESILKTAEWIKENNVRF